ncbi:MAG: hypothetical protein P1U40_03860 [Coxiellaceae bacterium]|nr:hypothetical protein [Coxiellaceae bacterium]
MKVYDEFLDLLRSNIIPQLKPTSTQSFSSYPGAPKPLDQQLKNLLDVAESHKDVTLSQEQQLHALITQLAAIELALQREVFLSAPANATTQYNLSVVKLALINFLHPHFPDINAEQSFSDIADYFHRITQPVTDPEEATRNLVRSVAEEITQELPQAIPFHNSASRHVPRAKQIPKQVRITITETGVTTNGDPEIAEDDKLQDTTHNEGNKVLHAMQVNWLNTRIKQLTKETKSETNINARKNVKLGILVLLKLKMQKNNDYFVLANDDVNSAADELATTLNQLNNKDRQGRNGLVRLFSSESTLTREDMKSKLYAGFFSRKTAKLKVLTQQGDAAIRHDGPQAAG